MLMELQSIEESVHTQFGSFMISIIIPVYNVGQYIEQCLQSVMSQQVADPVECILVDDCGTDNSLKIAEDLVSGYCGDIKFSIVHHQQNRGLSAARNTGMDAASGDWIFFLDSDDWLLPNCLSSLVGVLRRYPESDVIISSMESDNKWVVKESLVNRPDIPDYSEDPAWIMKGLLSRPVLFPLSAWNKLYRRSFIINNKLRFLEGYIREDEIWSFHWTKYAKKIAFNKSNTYHYRINPEGIVKTSKDYHSASYNMRIIEHYLDNISSFGKELQLQLISTMLLDAYIITHHDPTCLEKSKSLFRKLYDISGLKKKIGCLVFLLLPHQLVCKRPIFLPTKHYLFSIEA